MHGTLEYRGPLLAIQFLPLALGSLRMLVSSVAGLRVFVAIAYLVPLVTLIPVLVMNDFGSAGPGWSVRNWLSLHL